MSHLPQDQMLSCTGHPNWCTMVAQWTSINRVRYRGTDVGRKRQELEGLIRSLQCTRIRNLAEFFRSNSAAQGNAVLNLNGVAFQILDSLVGYLTFYRRVWGTRCVPCGAVTWPFPGTQSLMGDGWLESHKSHTAGDDPWLQLYISHLQGHIHGNKQNRKFWVNCGVFTQSNHCRSRPSPCGAGLENGDVWHQAENSPDLSLCNSRQMQDVLWPKHAGF